MSGTAQQRARSDETGFPDVSDPAIYQSDSWEPAFARLRHEDPVHHFSDSMHGPYWAVTRYADIMEVELNDAVFSSSSEWGGIQIQDTGDISSRRNFIRMDRPEHTAQRKTVAPIVAPTNLARMTDSIRQRTGTILDDLPTGTDFDWVDRVSVPLTTMMLAILFDFPFDEREKLTFWSDVGLADINAPDSPVRTEAERTVILQEMATRFRVLFDERAAMEPKFDLISMLAHSGATRNMSDAEFMGTVMLLIIGGNDTTRNSMTGSVLGLHQFPDQDRLLRQDPGLVDKLVSETIRWQTPLIHMRRTANRDTELAGKQIARGDKVVMWYVSGNFDETVFPNPTAFDLQRPNARRHLSFGAGIHRCVGDRLAELQLRILWEEILRREMALEVTGAPERIYSNNVRGIRRMPVRVASRA